MSLELLYRRLKACRVCGSSYLDRFLSLGETPLANAFIRPEHRDRNEPRFPLEVVRCERCALVQLSIVVRPEVLFRTYPYASSASAPLLAHFDRLAEELVRRFAPPGSLVVDVGSNDGILLRPLMARGVRVVGVEPAANLAAIANADGLETWNDFFGTHVAGRLVGTKGRAKVVSASNVFAHIDDLHEVLRALDILLDDDGVFVAEVPYVLDLLDNVEYDTIYHEHLSYFALAPLRELLATAGFALFDVRRLQVHGGSVRLFAARRGRWTATPQLEEALGAEEERRVGEPGTYAGFADKVVRSREALRALLGRLRSQGKRLAAYGATAKGNTLLNYCEIGTETLEFIADTTPFKHGLLSPGTHIPVVPDDALVERRPDYALLLAWNYADAVVRRHAKYLAVGGRFIHPIPTARVL